MSRERQRFVTVTIAINTAASDAFELQGHKVVSVTTPAAWTAADLTFNIDPTGTGTFTKVIDSAGAALKIAGVATAAAETYVLPEAGDLITGQSCKIVSTNSASEADVNQDAARTLIVQIAPLS
jgi:hypothetical protein